MNGQKNNLQIIDTLRRLNRIFVSTRDIKELLSQLCDTIISIGDFSSVWMAVVTKNKNVIHFAESGLGDYGAKLKEVLFEKGLNHCSRLSIEKGEAFFVEKDEKTCDDCPLLQADEYFKTLNLPVFFQGKLLGVVALAVKNGYEQSELEKNLLNEFCYDLGNAINTIQLEDGKKRLTDTINRLTKSISGNTSREVLDSFMKNLLISLNADYAFIGRLIPGYEDRIKTITVGTRDGIIENFEYTLKGTPCEEVVKKDICCYPVGVSNIFPNDIMLSEMGIEAYIGSPLVDSKKETIGIMVVLKKAPFKSETLARYIFQVFAGRASSELMRYYTEQKILESEAQYQASIEQSRFPIYIIVGRNYALVNKAWLELFEYTEEEVKSPDFSIVNIAAPESEEMLSQRLNNFISGISQPFHYELKAISKSGKKYDLDVNVSHLTWGGKRAVQGVYRNITASKNNEKLIKAELKALFEANQMKTAFLSSLSKEIQSTIREINSRVCEIQSQFNTEELNGFTEFILGKNTTLLNHVNDIHDLSDIELGKLSFEKEKFVLHELLKEVIQDLTPRAKKKGIDLNCCNLKFNSIKVSADPKRVKQILFNLIGNAIKFTEAGKIEVNYSIRVEDVRISIADTGIGFSEKKLKDLYQSFLNPNGKFSGSYDGTGLGLSLTRSLVQLMNGKIWIEPRPGGGSIFYFTIPLA